MSCFAIPRFIFTEWSCHLNRKGEYKLALFQFTYETRLLNFTGQDNRDNKAVKSQSFQKCEGQH